VWQKTVAHKMLDAFSCFCTQEHRVGAVCVAVCVAVCAAVCAALCAAVCTAGYGAECVAGPQLYRAQEHCVGDQSICTNLSATGDMAWLSWFEVQRFI